MVNTNLNLDKNAEEKKKNLTFIKTFFDFPGVVSEGRTLLKYHANSNSMLSFGKNQNVKILSKGDGTQQDIWGVEVSRPFTFASFCAKKN